MNTMDGGPAMDMLDRYLEAVAAQLPKASRDDIIAELRDMLLTRCEAEEEKLGRPLTDDEREAILRETGHPLAVAARYRKGPQSLIGPELFPYWLFGVKAGLAILAAIQLLGLALDVLGGTPNSGQAIAQAIHGFLTSGLTLIGTLTLAGAIFEHSGFRPPYLDNWRVKDLAVLRLSDPANWAAEKAGEAPRKSGRRSRSQWRGWPGAEPLAGIIAGTVFVLWWIGAVHFPGLVSVGLRGEDARIVAAPIWTTLHTTILLYALLKIAIEVSRLIQPQARRLQALAMIAANGWGLWLAWTVFEAGHWATLLLGGESVEVRGGPQFLNFDALRALANTSHDGLAEIGPAMAVMFSWGLLGLALGLIIEIGKNLGRLTARD